MKENKISRRSFLKFGAAASAVGMLAAAPVAAQAAEADASTAADEENCSWMTRWMSDKVSMLRASFPGESLNEIYKNLMAQRDLPAYIRSLDFVPEWVSCEYHTAYKNAGFIDELHEMGIKVSLWTVDMEDTVRSLLRTSADDYITNRPDRVREWMEKEQAATAAGK